MKTSSLIIGLIIILLIIAPPFYLSRYARRKKKLVRKLFHTFCKEHQMTPSSEEHWNTVWIGIDTTNKILAYMVNPDNPTLKGAIKHEDITDVKINKQISKAKGTIEKIDLVISLKSQDNVVIPVYNNQENDPLDAHSFYEKAVKWENLIKQNLDQKN